MASVQLPLNLIDQSVILSIKNPNAYNRLMVPKERNVGESVLIFIKSMNKLHESALITQTTMNKRIEITVWAHLSCNVAKVRSQQISVLSALHAMIMEKHPLK